MQRPGRALLIVLVLGLLGGLRTAYGDPLSKPSAADARDHLARGNRLYGIRSFEEAAVEYKAGALVEPAPVFDYNLGQCFRQLGKYKEAIWHYERFLNRASPQGKLLDAVNNFIAQMKGELDRKAMTVQPIEPAPPAIATRGEPTPAEGEAWYKDTWGWTLTGAGLVGVTVGGALLANASSLNSDANKTTNQQQRDQLRDKEHSRAAFGAITGVAGLGLLASGIVKLAIYPTERSRVARWDIGVTHHGLVVLGHF
jgi:tetratricopeptide (TPR) repeat protein